MQVANSIGDIQCVYMYMWGTYTSTVGHTHVHLFVHAFEATRLVVTHFVLCIRFCRGCTIPCDSRPMEDDDPHYLAVEWNDAFLHLKYQSVLERVSPVFN